MKKVFISIISISLFMAACGHKSIGDKQARLEILKKKADSLNTVIASLEADIAKTDTSKKDEKAKIVAVQSVMPQSFTNYITVQGRVDAEENVTISPEAGGIVSKIMVSAGAEVVKGQLLAELDAKVIEQGIAELQNSLDLATTLYEKQKNLWDQKIGTEVQFISAKNQKEGLEKKMATLKQQLEMTRIKSPINGTVDEVFLKLGQMAAPGFPAVRVVNFTNLKVKAEVPENYASKVKKGNPVLILFPDIEDSLSAELSFSAKVINTMSRTFNVEVQLGNTKDYRPNMIAILKIIDYSSKAAIVVPEGTIQHAEDGDFVFIAKDKRAKKQKVIVGHEYNGKAEITAGLSQGDQLITLGYQDLNEGEAIGY